MEYYITLDRTRIYSFEVLWPIHGIFYSYSYFARKALLYSDIFSLAIWLFYTSLSFDVSFLSHDHIDCEAQNSTNDLQIFGSNIEF